VTAGSQTIEVLVRNAHRRRVLLLSIEQAAIAASLVFAGCILILLLGTQLLNWYWLVLLGGFGLALAGIRVRQRFPQTYLTAQALDTRLSLHDSISTAWYIGRVPEIATTPAGQAQISQAEALASGVNPASVFPLRMHRSWAFALALGALALSLFSVRYLVQRNTSLSQSLVPLRLKLLSTGSGDQIGGKKAPEATARSLTDQQKDTRQQLAKADATDARLNDIVGMKNPAAAPSEDEKGHGNSLPDQSPSDGKSTGDGKDAGKDGRLDSSSPGGEKDDATGTAQNGEEGDRSQASGDEQSDSLISRMKDAVSSFMAKMKPDSSSRTQRSQSQSAAAPDQDQTQTESGQSKSKTSASQSSQANSKSEATSSEQAQATEMSQSGDSRNSGSSENKEGNQSKSGIGKQDGGKDVQLAQEKEAMGKLAEIIGKRSRDVSGEMMVEVPSGRQQLKTAYTGEIAQHSDTSGEINRDEIPVALQPYVRAYMEMVRERSAAK
jgi:hypothetical protein